MQVHHCEELGLDCQHPGGGRAPCVRDALSRCDQNSCDVITEIFMTIKLLSMLKLSYLFYEIQFQRKFEILSK